MTRALVVGSLALSAVLAAALGSLAWQAPPIPDRPVPSPTAEGPADPALPGTHGEGHGDRPGSRWGLEGGGGRASSRGPVAQTTTILTLPEPAPAGPGRRAGLPLPEGAVVSGYGLDVDGELVDGVPVEKQAAASPSRPRSAGAWTRAGRVVQGNVFRTRVYPIRPGGTEHREAAVTGASCRAGARREGRLASLPAGTGLLRAAGRPGPERPGGPRHGSTGGAGRRRAGLRLWSLAGKGHWPRPRSRTRPPRGSRSMSCWRRSA